MSDATPNQPSTDSNRKVIHAKHVIPVEPANQVLEDHCVVVSEGIIEEICSSAEGKEKYDSYEHIHLEQHALIPGLINAHGHSAMALFRGIANDLPLMEWLNDHIWPAEGKWVSEDFVRDGTRLAIGEMLKSGTTTFSDMYFFPNIAAEEANKAGIRAQLVCPVLDFPTIWGSGPEEYLEKALNLSIEYAENDLINIGFGPHAPYTVSDAPLNNIKELSIEHDIPVQIHLHETAFEVEEAVNQTGERPITRLHKLGLLSPDIPLQCVHMTSLNEEDISILKSTAASVIHCPESNLKLASGFCEVQKLLDSGINVALGTDGAASNNDLDMLGEMRTAALIAKPIANDASALNANKALHMATLAGAKALGIDQLTGSLAKGKSADIVAINLDALSSQPSFDPVADIVYSASSNQISHVWVNGTPKVSEGQLVDLDESELIRMAKEWQQKIQETSSGD